MTIFEERAMNGIKWLDKNIPGWLNCVDEKQLFLAHGCQCILGQIATRKFKHPGYFKGGGTPFAYVVDRFGLSQYECQELGFFPTFSKMYGHTIDAQEDAWKRLLIPLKLSRKNPNQTEQVTEHVPRDRGIRGRYSRPHPNRISRDSRGRLLHI